MTTVATVAVTLLLLPGWFEDAKTQKETERQDRLK